VPLVTVQELIDAGAHFGHQARRWNPKMKPFIHGKRHKIHIINLEETIRGLYQACHFLRKLASTGSQILFLGTKKQIRTVVESESKRCGMPGITERWIGGTLTNFSVVRERLKRLEELEGMEANGTLDKFKKKDQSMLRREMKKIRRNLEGVKELRGLPGAIVVVDPRREEITVKEATRMNVPVVCILDTDCDPDQVDIPIPANDDAMSSVQLLLSKLADAVAEGRADIDPATLSQAQKAAEDDVRARPAQGRKASDRPQSGRRGGPRRGDGGGGRQGGGGGGVGRGARPAGGRFERGGGPQAESVSFGTEGAEAAAAASAAPGASPAPAPDAAPAAPAAPEAPAAPAPESAGS
jgi:small subunit ribosomal protein S2